MQSEIIKKKAEQFGDAATEMFIKNPQNASWILSFVHQCMTDYHEANIEVSQPPFPILPTDIRIKEKALECLHSGECDSYNNPEELFVEGAKWMRNCLTDKH